MHLHKHTYSCSINYSDVKLTTWVWVCALFSLQYWLHFAKQKNAGTYMYRTELARCAANAMKGSKNNYILYLYALSYLQMIHKKHTRQDFI